MADLLVDSSADKVPRWYSGKYHASDLIEEAYEATDFFPDLGKGERWFYSRRHPGFRGELIGAVRRSRTSRSRGWPRRPEEGTDRKSGSRHSRAYRRHAAPLTGFPACG